MKQLLFWCFAMFFTMQLSAQKKRAFEQTPLQDVLPNIEQFYKVKFSFTDAIIESKKVTIILDDVISISDLLLTLETQTNLKFELISPEFIVISKFRNTDLITICGYLESNNNSVSNAVIQLNNQIYTSDDHGYFYIENMPYGALLKVHSFGVMPTNIIAKNHLYPNCKAILLLEKKEIIDQVVIDEYLTSGVTKNVKQTTINTSKLKLLPGLITPDIVESIQQIPGVHNLNEGANTFYVRGGESDQNLVLWNNIPFYNTAHLFGAISLFNPHVVDHVNFISKGTSATYHNRISSAIDMLSNTSVSNDSHGTAGFNLLYADAFATLPIIDNKLTLTLSGRRSHTNFFDTNVSENYIQNAFLQTAFNQEPSAWKLTNPQFDFYDYTLQSMWKSSPSCIVTTQLLQSKDIVRFSGLNNDTNQLENENFIIKNSGYGINWNKEWNALLTQEIGVTFSEYSAEQAKSQFPSITEVMQENSINDIGAHLKFNYSMGAHDHFILGYQYTHKKLSHLLANAASFPFDFNAQKSNTNSLFIEYQSSIPSNYLFTIGLRGDAYNTFKKLYLAPRAVFQKFVIPEFSINASLEYKSQSLNQLQELFTTTLPEFKPWFLADTNTFNPTTSHQYTIGANFSKDKWVVDFEAYFKKSYSLHFSEINFNNPQEYSYHEGNSSIQGIDLFIKKQFLNYNTWMSYSFNSTQYRIDTLNNMSLFSSNTAIDHTLKWSHFYKWKTLEFSLGWLWRSGKPYTEFFTDESENIQYSSLNSKQLSPYHRLDFSMIYEFKSLKNKKIKYRLGLSILNIYNKKNTLSTTYSRLATNELETNIEYGTPLTPNIVFRVFW